MAQAFNGRWKLVGSENVEAFIAAAGSNSKEILEQAKDIGKNEIVNEVVASGDKLSIVYFYNGAKEAEESHMLNQEQEIDTVDGRKMKSKWTMDGDKIVFTETGPFNAQMVIENKGDHTLSTYTCGGASCTLKMQKL